MILMLMVGLVALGFAIFLTGYVWNGITARKCQLDHREAAGVGKEGAWRFKGRATGFAWSDEIGFAELKRGVQDGTWRRSARLQQFLLVTAGGVLTVVALTLLIGWVTRPTGMVLGIGLVIYVLIQLGRGFRRAQ